MARSGCWALEPGSHQGTWPLSLGPPSEAARGDSGDVVWLPVLPSRAGGCRLEDFWYTASLCSKSISWPGQGAVQGSTERNHYDNT